jgi:hypothetical protein
VPRARGQLLLFAGAIMVNQHYVTMDYMRSGATVPIPVRRTAWASFLSMAGFKSESMADFNRNHHQFACGIIAWEQAALLG